LFSLFLTTLLFYFREHTFADVSNLEHCAKYLNQSLVTFGFPASLDLFANDPVRIDLRFCFVYFFFVIVFENGVVFENVVGFYSEDLQLYILFASAETA
jgi:hypothetical protein